MEHLCILFEQVCEEEYKYQRDSRKIGYKPPGGQTALAGLRKDMMGGVAVTSVWNETSLALVAVRVGQANYRGESLKDALRRRQT